MYTRLVFFSLESIRASGHGRQMLIQRSSYLWNSLKDDFHFYFLLGVVPLTLITTYANIFIGSATLTEIPEGYTPHYWEYYKVGGNTNSSLPIDLIRVLSLAPGQSLHRQVLSLRQIA